MIRANGLWANNLDTSIAEVIGEQPQLFDGFSWVFITSLDSLRDLERDSMVQSLRFPHRFSGGGLIVEGKSMRQLQLMNGMFSGFDELWCYKQDISMPKPREVQLVGPLAIKTVIPESVRRWMEQSQCILGLGDGVGLNYVTSDLNIAKLLEEND